MAETFAMINILIKGTGESIKNALNKIEPDSYKIKPFTFNSKKVKPEDKTIVKVGLIFKKWYEDYISKDEIPFASMPDIKFIGLGNGCDGSRLDGSYVFYKDFGEESISECYRFTHSNPQMEEFDGQYDVFEKVQNSFMDHPWQYSYLNYSCGEYDLYAFNGKKDKALIKKWKSDEIDLNKEVKKVEIGGMKNKKFSYETIDGVPTDFYNGIFDGKDFIVGEDKIVEVDKNGSTFCITIKTEKKMKSLLKKFKKSVLGKDLGRDIYDPLDVAQGKYEICGSDQYNQPLYTISDSAETLANNQIAHRALIFAKINEMLSDKKCATDIIDAVPKKKNGLLAIRKVTQIASLFCMEDDASMYALCAVAKGDTNLLIEVRQIASVDLEKTKNDIISSTNLFRI